MFQIYQGRDFPTERSPFIPAPTAIPHIHFTSLLALALPAKKSLLWQIIPPITATFNPHPAAPYKIGNGILYLQDTAYDYQRRAGQEYLLSYRVLRSTDKDITLL